MMKDLESTMWRQVPVSAFTRGLGIFKIAYVIKCLDQFGE